MVSVLAPSTVDRGFEPRSGLTKAKKIVFVASPLTNGIMKKEQRLVGSESMRHDNPRTVVSLS